ncbi:hypothetical protein BDC45DRAFT_43363 [Circinella umbellata]|nr:hypothetical protein BDC45DRAFT_43363 [Circinella umbellata]
MNYSQQHSQNPTQSSSVPSQSFPPQEWFSQTAQNNNNFEAPLQEPVPFEEFQFTFDLGPDFAMPVPLDMAPMNDVPLLDESQFQNFTAAAEAAVTTTEELPPHEPPSIPSQQLTVPSSSSASSSSHYHHHHHRSHQQLLQPPQPPSLSSNTVLDEDDQKTFSQFLDTFFMDQDMQVDPLPSHMPSLYDQYPSQNMDDNNGEDEERRRTSILRSLDEQKRQHQHFLQANHQHNPMDSSSSSSSSWSTTTPSSSAGNNFRHDAVYLKKSETISFPRQQQQQQQQPVVPTHPHIHHDLPHSHSSSSSSHQHQSRESSSPMTATPLRASTSASTASPTSSYNKRPSTDDHDMISNKMAKRPSGTRVRSRPQKELLTEAEKRANHIASEQKRRTTIRTGFKDLTEIVPTLKNINNSKSTVLFKAVDYIRYLEKRTKSLKEKVNTLEMRVQVEGRKEVILQDRSLTPTATNHNTTTATTMMSNNNSHHYQNQQHHHTNNTNNHNNNEHHHHQEQHLNNNNNKSSNHQGQQHHFGKVNSNKNVTACAQDALEKHKEHLKSLMQFQEQLHFQQKLMAQHDFSGSTPRSTSRAFRPVHEESDARMMAYGPSTSSTTTNSRPDTNTKNATSSPTTSATSKATVSA